MGSEVIGVRREGWTRRKMGEWQAGFERGTLSRTQEHKIHECEGAIQT